MVTLQIDTIRQLADSPIIFKRGEFLQKNGAFRRIAEEGGDGRYVYEVDGTYGNYRTEVVLNGGVSSHCDCPYPGPGCKHIVAILLELFDQQGDSTALPPDSYDQQAHYLSYEEIKQQALDDRRRRAKQEVLTISQGDMLKGDHLVTTVKGRQYQVTLHNPASGVGHCSCPDFYSNKLSTCKHLIFLSASLQEQKGFAARLARETFPYIDIFWDSAAGKPRLFHEQDSADNGEELIGLLTEIFDGNNLFRHDNIVDFIPYLHRLERFKQVRVQEPVMRKLTDAATDKELAHAAAAGSAAETTGCLRVTPYAYQQEGIAFGLYKKAVLIGDEMGLGKTLQAIGLCISKKNVFGFQKVLVVTVSSLKQQWQREIERFSDENACIIAGNAQKRKEQYGTDSSLFKITNYEAVLRDVTIISRLKPDVIVLDEAQRITRCFCPPMPEGPV
jgi:hypothetical protein